MRKANAISLFIVLFLASILVYTAARVLRVAEEAAADRIDAIVSMQDLGSRAASSNVR